MKANKDLPVLLFKSEKEWERWLDKNYSKSSGIWMKIAKKETGIKSIYYPEALDTALCYGWIDGQKKPFDNTFWLQKFTHRLSKSKWSKKNRNRADELIKLGKMKPEGQKEIDLAKKDGRWEAAYESQRNIGIPEDFQNKMDENPGTLEFFNSLNKVNKYAILYRIHDAKRPETRIQRIEKFIQMLKEKKKIH
ncbi:MAG: YdeI/OmpD-associated family protein [Bacteroidetes bacterium]|nr:YdeI/OmpD-associated family protein [Bacteroidota bacterium]